MAHKLRDGDLNLLKVHTGLVDYLNEAPQGGKRCGRLLQYLGFARRCLEMLEGVDSDAETPPNQPSRKVSEDLEKLENLTAGLIADKDRDLLGMLHAVQLDNEHVKVCHMFARMVIYHAHDPDLTKLSHELGLLGIKCLGVDK
jgi:hypothetical protein